VNTDPYRIVVRPEADAEIADAARWYESQEHGLGFEFLRAFRTAVAVLRRNPFTYQKVMMETRRVLLRRFPYSVFYEVHDDDVVILACFHTGRNPEAWQERITR
jgi:plasmid stabilization system protein ParE